MNKTDPRYQAYVHILEEELLPAMGCTEPIAVAYAAALARAILGKRPDRLVIHVSGNILKNVKSVVVPNTGGQRGTAAAAAAGVVAGDAEKELEVIASVTPEQQAQISAFLQECPVQVELADSDQIFYIGVTAYAGEEYGKTVITGYHTNVVLKERSGQVLLQKKEQEAEMESPYDEKSLLSIKGILDFAETVDLDDVRGPVQRQIDYNWAISQEGLRGNYGANIGSVILQNYGR